MSTLTIVQELVYKIVLWELIKARKQERKCPSQITMSLLLFSILQKRLWTEVSFVDGILNTGHFVNTDTSAHHSLKFVCCTYRLVAWWKRKRKYFNNQSRADQLQTSPTFPCKFPNKPSSLGYPGRKEPRRRAWLSNLTHQIHTPSSAQPAFAGNKFALFMEFPSLPTWLRNYVG